MTLRAGVGFGAGFGVNFARTCACVAAMLASICLHQRVTLTVGLGLMNFVQIGALAPETFALSWGCCVLIDVTIPFFRGKSLNHFNLIADLREGLKGKYQNEAG